MFALVMMHLKGKRGATADVVAALADAENGTQNVPLLYHQQRW